MLCLCVQVGDSASLDQFSHLFDDVQFRKGLPLAFTATKKGLVAQIDGKEVRGPRREDGSMPHTLTQTKGNGSVLTYLPCS